MEKSLEELLAELKSDAEKAAESIPEDRTAEPEEQPVEEPAAEEAPEEVPVEEPAAEETPAEEPIAEETLAEEPVPDVADIIPEEPERDHVAGAADAELLATKYDLEEELSDLEGPLEEEKPQEEKPLEVTQQFDPALAEEDDEDDDEEEAVSRHIFLKIVIAILIVCAVFELAVFGFSKLAPDAGATQVLIQIEEAIRAALASAFEAVKGLFGGR